MIKTVLLMSALLASNLFAQNRETIIIDNKDSRATSTGSWQSTKSSSQKFGEDYEYSSSNEGPQPSSTFEYRPNISVAGRYNVDIWYAQGDRRATNTPWTVVCSSGKTTVAVNQQKDGGHWVTIARGQQFDAGTGGYVTVGNNTGQSGYVVVADAIRFVPVDGESGVTLSLVPSAGGTINKKPSKSGYEIGAAVELSAIPEEGYVFAGWTGDITGMANPASVTMTGNKSVGANFVQGGVGVIMEIDEAKLFGDWQSGNKQYGKPHGAAYYWISRSPGGKATATYTPNLPKAGIYDIYAWNIPGQNRARDAAWEIISKSGKQVVRVNQQTGPNEWILVASQKEFEAGSASRLRLMNDSDQHDTVVVADAVAFVYMGSADGAIDSAKK